MRLLWKVFRAVVSVLLLLAVLLPAAIYVLLPLEPVQEHIRSVTEASLSNILGAEVSVGAVAIHPFNRATLNHITLCCEGDTIADINTVSAAFELMPLLAKREIYVDYALLDGVNVHISRPSKDKPLNIAPILARLRSDNKPRREGTLNISVATVVVRRASASYDVLSEPVSDESVFDSNHLSINNLALNAYIPRISNHTYIASIDHLSFDERCGFVVNKISGQFNVTPDSISLSGLKLELPNSSLSFAPLQLRVPEGSSYKDALKQTMLNVATNDESYIYPPDLQAFAPMLASIDETVGIEFDIAASLNKADVRQLNILSDNNAIRVLARASIEKVEGDDRFTYHVDKGFVDIDGSKIARYLSTIIPTGVRRPLSHCPILRLDMRASGTYASGSYELLSDGTLGDISVSGAYRVSTTGTATVDADVKLADVDLAILSGNKNLGMADADIRGKLRLGKRVGRAEVDADIATIDLGKHTYSDISVNGNIDFGRRAEASITIGDTECPVKAYALYDTDSLNRPTFNATAAIQGADLHALGLDAHHEGYRMFAKINVMADNADLKRLSGNIELNDFSWVDQAGNGLKLERFSATARPDGLLSEIRIESPIVNGSLKGDYDFVTLVPQIKDLTYHFFPVLDRRKPQRTSNRHKQKVEPVADNQFDFNFRIVPDRQLTEFFNLPAELLDDVTINGRVDIPGHNVFAEISAPYILQGNKIIEGVALFAQMDIASGNALLYATAQLPTKKGDMALSTTMRGADNRVNTHIDWAIDRAIPLNGTMDFSARLISMQAPAGSAFPVEAELEMHPGTVNFGDEVWHIEPSKITVTPDCASVEDFALDTGSQRIEIQGTAGLSEDHSLALNLSDVSLLPIFENLEIDKALIGGRASGHFKATNLLSGAPHIYCPDLHVDSIGYNRCPIGNADITASWNNAEQGVYLDAAIKGFEGRQSHIDGYIYPMKEALDINFNADSIPVSFLKPFMEAFTSDINGRASGHCRLFGTFKEIDLEGDVFAHDVTLKIDFTNTTYSASDSIHLSPGNIKLQDITIRDRDGHTAKLNGYVGHTFFKEPVFRFDITDAVNFLSYNVTERQNPDWYGTIYGNGRASVSGYPGTVNIGVDMSTAPQSTFTFVLSDRLDAEDYSFLTFRDVTPDSLRCNIKKGDDTPEIVRILRENIGNENNDVASDYNMDIAVNVTPDANISLVMDPAGGDEIKAVGNGALHMLYKSANNDLNIWGKYIVSSGSYRFTLQDIIIKDFTIKEGSEIQFDGDPYGVKTNLSAYYATNANLSDLDESFLQDKEVARTNVPVHAVMLVNGDIRQPTIDFDLEFPTLTQDTYRKVRSIVSTDDMMNRQIIYLLALNRFYTPDYMTNTTKGSELFSVASSTISSQLGSMLGKLSENWSIAPNLRSDRGDFSDVEVDVALSSRLLNNRLIFNGNFGYRDKALNSNQFIGDFDIEYLLNKRGSWRLKAYNRYNDRNYYVRTAQTTQGLGIMFRRDFDSLGSFLRRHNKQKTDTVSPQTTDTKQPTAPVDTTQTSQ